MAANDRPVWLGESFFPFQSRFVRVGGHEIHYVNEGNTVVDLDRGSRSPDVGLVGGTRRMLRCRDERRRFVRVDASLVLGARLSNVVAAIWGVFASGVISLVDGGATRLSGSWEAEDGAR